MAPSPLERSTVAAPFVVQPTNEWDGDDGNWSSFAISVGTPPQYFRVLPSTSSPDITIPIEEGCEGILLGLPNCGGLRGSYDGSPFLRNTSTTWSFSGLYQVFVQQSIFNETGLFGTDTVSIGRSNDGSNNATVKTQTVIGVSQEDFWLGSVGLNSQSSNFSGFVTPSFISQLKNQSVIPSLSYGYMAGQYYNNLVGSLILGGYDQSKIDSAIVTAPINTTSSPPTIDLGISSIVASNTLSGSTQALLSSAVTASIDTSVNQIWLPNSTCDAFASAFGLTYDNATDLYWVNDTIHSALKSKNPSVTFRVGGQSVGSEINIVLNYNALDLSITPPLNQTSQAYFPIRRARTDKQITLGRAFLQEAYLVVDWERNNFTISSLVNKNGSPNILAITSPPPGTNSSSSNTTSNSNAGSSSDGSSSSGISGGAIGGIVVGVIAIFAILAGLAFWWRRRKQQERINARKSVETQPPAYDEGAEFYGSEGKPGERPALTKSPHETMSEMHDSSTPRAELTSDNVQRLERMAAQGELDGMPINPVGELEGATPGSEIGELEGGAIGSELETASNRPESSITRASVVSPERRSLMSPARQSLASPERARSPLARDSSVFELE